MVLINPPMRVSRSLSLSVNSESKDERKRPNVRGEKRVWAWDNEVC